ncbi:MAG: L,D-transpeptidase family protein [Sphingobacteriales bacterium]|nr:L,D-transpeptidase family protein [Sphingobacteriales bacterium]
MAVSTFGTTSCKNNSSKAETIQSKVLIPKDEMEFQKDMSIVLGEYIGTFPASDKNNTRYLGWQELVRTIYEQHSFHPVWVNKDGLSAKGKEMLHVLSTAEFLGLNKELYGYEKLRKLADSVALIQPGIDFSISKQLEVGLTRSFLQIALHMDDGMFADTSIGITSNFIKHKEDYIALLQKTTTDSIAHVIASLEPNNPMYNRYMAALRDFVAKNNISSRPIHIRNPKQDSLGAVTDTRMALVYHHYLIDSLKNNDSAYLIAIKRFQKDNNLNNDGVIGANTIKALERDNAKKFQLLAINADRWRKEHILQLPERYVWVNLPSYKLKIVEADTVRLEKRVVIGKSNKKNETPILESAINQIVLWPTWTVPQNIVKQEMKSFRGFIVTRHGNWTTVVQPPGPNNALGTVKMLFPNKYSVYMHDTPAKSFFNSDVRAGSHGCVRCQDALEIAYNLMVMDTFTISIDTLKAIRDRKIETQVLRLKTPVPVYFRYFTAEADFNGVIRFYADVYNRDKQMINFIFNGKKPHVYTKEELRERAVADSLSILKKKKADAALAEAKLKQEKERLLSPNVMNYPSKPDTTSARHDSL